MGADLLTDPECLGLVQSESWSVLLDWLEDHGAGAAEVARLYAGTAPAHTDGIPRSVLAEWLNRQGLPRQRAAVKAIPCRKWYMSTRWECWVFGHRRLELDHDWRYWASVNESLLPSEGNCWYYRQYASVASEAIFSTAGAAKRAASRDLDLPGRAIREVKRQVLALPWCENAVIDRALMPPPPWLSHWVWIHWYARDLITPEKES